MGEKNLKKIYCKNHNLVICIPETDSEFIQLTDQIMKLFDHLKNFPKRLFSEAFD